MLGWIAWPLPLSRYASHSKRHDFLLWVWECVGTGELWAWNKNVIYTCPNPGNLVLRLAGVDQQATHALSLHVLVYMLRYLHLCPTEEVTWLGSQVKLPLSL